MTWTVTSLSGTNANGSATVSSASISPAANALLFAMWSTEIAGTPAAEAISDTLSGGSLTWTPLNHATDNDFHSSGIWWAVTGASPGTGVVSVNITSQGTMRQTLTITQVEGADLVSPIVQSKNNSGNFTSNPSTTLNLSPASDSLVLGFLHIESNTAVTEGAGFTLVSNQLVGTTEQTATEYDDTTPGSTVTWTTTYSNWSNVIGVEVGAPQVPKPFPFAANLNRRSV